MKTSTNLARVRAAFDELGIDGIIVPREDAHLGREVPLRGERLAWVTGFTGSAGLAIVGRDAAAIFVDGRYVVQADREVDTAVIEIAHLTNNPPFNWIAERLPSGTRIGYTPKFHSIADARRFEKAANQANLELVRFDNDPLDMLWHGRPTTDSAPIVPHDLMFAGIDSREKLQKVGDVIASEQRDAAVLNALESVAWVFNIRGGDLESTPVARGNAIVRKDGSAELFIDPAQINAELLQHLGNQVVVRPDSQFALALTELGAEEAKVSVDPAVCNAWIWQTLEDAGADVHFSPDPSLLLRACKNDVEIKGARACHKRDGAALTGYIRWLQQETARRNISEIDAQEELYRRRLNGEHFRGSSFPSISAAGPNAALCHYRASPETVENLNDHPIYLIDSGGQYFDGTTDVTRTIAIGEPTEEMRRNFTLVVKGHIALASVRFPLGTTGEQLNVLARQFLWQAGLDYDHSTGHGVGSYLCVHEGPQRFIAGNSAALLPGMIISNEPGYYKAGEYGMRFENLMVVREAGVFKDTPSKLLEFETITLSPLDRKLLNLDLLTKDEIAWIDSYHTTVREGLAQLLADDDKDWFFHETRPLQTGGPVAN
jgi:Xaa-Pro aminopeptidase